MINKLNGTHIDSLSGYLLELINDVVAAVVELEKQGITVKEE